MKALRVLVPPAAADAGTLPTGQVQAWPEAERRDPSQWIRKKPPGIPPGGRVRPHGARLSLPGCADGGHGAEHGATALSIRGQPRCWRRCVTSPAVKLPGTRCKRADRIIAVSGFVRDFLVGQWGLSADRVGVVRHGVSQDVADDSLRPPSGLEGLEDERWLFTAGSPQAGAGAGGSN